MGDYDYDPQSLFDDDCLVQPVHIPGTSGGSLCLNSLPVDEVEHDPPSPINQSPAPLPQPNDPTPPKWWEALVPDLGPLLGPSAPPLGPVNQAAPLPSLDPPGPIYGPPKPPPPKPTLPATPDLDYTLPIPPHPQPPSGHEPPTVKSDPSIPPPFFPGGDS